MTEVIKAVYEDGVLRPLQPLDLHERQTVYLHVVPQEALEDEGAEAVRILVAAGLLRPKPQSPPPPAPLSAKERRILADRLGHASGRPASEMVIEDRGEE
jgi:predicted DNA-binding antitoxin AbrB/MazE fold protein